VTKSFFLSVHWSNIDFLPEFKNYLPCIDQLVATLQTLTLATSFACLLLEKHQKLLVTASDVQRLPVPQRCG
jgi:hypothetical protein